MASATPAKRGSPGSVTTPGSSSSRRPRLEAPELSEELILLRALRDMNVPKFIREDAELFRVLLADLFPGVELPVTDYGQLQVAIERELERAAVPHLPRPPTP